MSSEKSSSRARIWTAVVYPESCPPNWIQLLDDQHVPWCCSPLHDRDVNADGEIKKAHWHILLAFEGMKSYDQVREILAPLNCPAPQHCHSINGTVRYFCHMDNPEKWQYSQSDIVAHCGFDLASALAPTSARRYQLISEMKAWCMEYQCTEFADLFEYADDCRHDDWFPLLCDNSAYVMQVYLRSARHRSQPT